MSGRGGQEGGYLEYIGGFLTGDMEDRVIPDVMNDVFLPQGRYPENFVLISQLEVCQEGGVKKGGTWRTLMGFLTGDLEDRVILDTMDDLGGPQGSYPEGFVSLSLFLAEIYKLVVLVNKTRGLQLRLGISCSVLVS